MRRLYGTLVDSAWVRRLAAGAALAMLTVAGALAEEERQITVRGVGSVLAVPDMAKVQVGVTTQAATATAALEENSDRASAILSLLEELGVASEDLQTANVSLFPVFERHEGAQTEPPRIVGYRASNSASVTVRELPRIGEMLDALVQAGATDIGALEFQAADLETLRDEALVLAMARAEEKAKWLSQAAGLGLGGLISVTEQFGGGPGPVVPARALAEAAVPVAPGQQRIQATVTATFALQE